MSVDIFELRNRAPTHGLRPPPMVGATSEDPQTSDFGWFLDRGGLFFFSLKNIRESDST